MARPLAPDREARPARAAVRWPRVVCVRATAPAREPREHRRRVLRRPPALHPTRPRSSPLARRGGARVAGARAARRGAAGAPGATRRARSGPRSRLPCRDARSAAARARRPPGAASHGRSGAASPARPLRRARACPLRVHGGWLLAHLVRGCARRRDPARGRGAAQRGDCAQHEGRQPTPSYGLRCGDGGLRRPVPSLVKRGSRRRPDGPWRRRGCRPRRLALGRRRRGAGDRIALPCRRPLAPHRARGARGERERRDRPRPSLRFGRCLGGCLGQQRRFGRCLGGGLGQQRRFRRCLDGCLGRQRRFGRCLGGCLGQQRRFGR